MYDMTNLVQRYFKIKLKNGKVIEVEPPKLKILKKILKLSKVGNDMSENDFENIIAALSSALSKNKQRYEVSAEYLSSNHNIDELLGLMTSYFNWVNEIQNSKN